MTSDFKIYDRTSTQRRECRNLDGELIWFMNKEWLEDEMMRAWFVCNEDWGSYPDYKGV